MLTTVKQKRSIEAAPDDCFSHVHVFAAEQFWLKLNGSSNYRLVETIGTWKVAKYPSKQKVKASGAFKPKR